MNFHPGILKEPSETDSVEDKKGLKKYIYYLL